MSDPEHELQNDPRAAESTENCGDLRRTVNLLFAGLIISSFTLTAYLGLEASRAASIAKFRKFQAETADKELKQTQAGVQAFLSKLSDFGRTHPDFQAKVLSKYQAPTSSSAGAKK